MENRFFRFIINENRSFSVVPDGFSWTFLITNIIGVTIFEPRFNFHNITISIRYFAAIWNFRISRIKLWGLTNFSYINAPKSVLRTVKSRSNRSWDCFVDNHTATYRSRFFFFFFLFPSQTFRIFHLHENPSIDHDSVNVIMIKQQYKFWIWIRQ